MRIFGWIRECFPRKAELVYSPRPSAGQERAFWEPVDVAPTARASMHYDHIHWAFSQDGSRDETCT